MLIKKVTKAYGCVFFFEKAKKIIMDALRSGEAVYATTIIRMIPSIFEVISKLKDERY